MLGQILIEQGSLAQEDLKRELEKKPEGMRFGTWLIHDGQLTSEQLAGALAQQAEVSFESFDAYEVPEDLVSLLPARIALHYAVFPIRREGERLIVASESALSPIVLAALRRKLGCEVGYVIALIGQVTVGLRHRYARYQQLDPRRELEDTVLFPPQPLEAKTRIWEYFVSRQILLGEVLQSLGRIDVAALSAMLLQQSESDLRLGDFLVQGGVITEETLQHAIEVQAEIQPSMSEVIALFAASEAEDSRGQR